MLMWEMSKGGKEVKLTDESFELASSSPVSFFFSLSVRICQKKLFFCVKLLFSFQVQTSGKFIILAPLFLYFIIIINFTLLK